VSICDADELFLRLALEAAAKGVGKTRPNPAVGAVIVRDGVVLATGWHRKAGEPHAEVEALNALNALPDPQASRGATLYVTLEPCSTHGRTPPCVEAILAAEIRRVVIGTLDPNPAHAGRAIGILEAAGVEVAVAQGKVEADCRQLNRIFNHWIVTGLPWVIAKAGMTLDGRLTRPPGEPQWITNKASREDTHRLRAQVDAILVGGGTLRADNPALTVRGLPPEAMPEVMPWRVIVSRSGALPPDAAVFTDAHRDRTLVFTGQPLRETLRELGRRGVTCILIEGGGRVLGEAFAEKLVSEVCFYVAPLLAGGPHPVVGSGPLEGIEIAHPEYHAFGEDLRLRGEVVYR